MRNYVIINGVNSLTIQGLAINIMPPISKPMMRNLREEIDGRNGDLITELGYQAYDKSIEIGLYGSYDINEVIAYFNQKGTIVFSDENDKYYNFTILDKIDYAKLLKFRNATLNIHCQPFKYPINETPITLTSGNNTIVNDGNIYSKPILALSGSGTLNISLNGVQMFTIDLTDTSSITIDTEKMEAYNPNNGVLLNRKVIGDYDTFKLPTGSNTLTINGTLGTSTITKTTRWL